MGTSAYIYCRERSFVARYTVAGRGLLCQAELVISSYAVVYRIWNNNRDETSLLKELCRALIDIYYEGFPVPSRSFEELLSGGFETAWPRGGTTGLDLVKKVSGISLDEIRNALGGLPEEIRPAAVMYYLTKFSCSEVAEIAGRQQEFTKSMIRRSHKLLKESLLGGAGGAVCLGTSAN